LERAFRYVNPSDENAGTFSIKFAEIILSTCNAYELLTKDLYAKFYNGDDPINILNYLALDLHLELAKRKVSHLAAIGSFPNHPEVNQPFISVAGWDKDSPVLSNHIPRWWTAYNKVKHSNEELQSYATLGMRWRQWLACSCQ
jgi:hypothetical protein